jgi:hypothetical protein
MKRFLKEPLFHFLAAGLGLFVLFGLANREPTTSDPKVIAVDRDALLTFIQYRLKAFNPELAEEKLRSLSSDELQRLIDDYVREEVLYREAVALDLGKDDYVVRRRLVQKLEFVTEGFSEASAEVDDAAIRRYFDANKGDYYVEPYVTFTHVFFDADKRSREEARALAEKKLSELNRKATPFGDAPRHGDRFLYHVNYVERTPEYVSNHFGGPMAKAIFELEPNDLVWRGPFDSPYGVHLVLLITNEPGREPELSEIAGRVREDARRALIRQRTEEAIADIVETYEVRLLYEPDSKPTSTESEETR